MGMLSELLACFSTMASVGPGISGRCSMSECMRPGMDSPACTAATILPELVVWAPEVAAVTVHCKRSAALRRANSWQLGPDCLCEQVLENLSPIKPPAFMSPPRPQQAPSADASRAPTPPAPGSAMEATSPAKRQHKRKRDSLAGEGGPWPDCGHESKAGSIESWKSHGAADGRTGASGAACKADVSLCHQWCRFG